MSDIPPDDRMSSDVPAAVPPAPAEDAASFADLTLWDVLGQGVRQPRATWGRFWDAIGGERSEAAAAPIPAGTAAARQAPVEPDGPAASAVHGHPRVNEQALVPALLVIAGVLLGLVGSIVMASGANRAEGQELRAGLPWLLLGFGLWLAAAFITHREAFRDWWLNWRGRHSPAAAESAEAPPVTGAHPDWRDRLEVYAPRLPLAAAALILSAGAYLFNGSNTFTPVGVIVWVASIFVWLGVLAPAGWTLRGWLAARFGQSRGLLGREMRFRLSWTALALIAIMLVGGYFRFAEFNAVPPEMTSDHVEKLLDAQRVLDGNHQVFFPNNGGREGVQMYLVAIFSVISGLGMQFATLKWVSVLEGLLTIPVLWWMARVIIGEKQPRLGNAVGLALAALVAVSYWHVALSRLALRIVLTPLIMALVMAYLARAMRHNRRADFLKAGLWLGIGLYCYQAVRMIPVVIVLGVILAVIFRARDGATRRQYALNLAALVLIAGAIFAPLGRFMVDSPNLFWMRTAGRFFGDDVIMETDPATGVISWRDATMQDRVDAFMKNLPVLGQNTRNALLMFNWKGDVAWINGAPNRPALDVISGTFLVLGTAVWIVRMIRRRDPFDWLVLPGLFIMLLPSALSIAFPVENPSATRTSGALPFVYLLAAYGLAQFGLYLERAFPRRLTRVVTVGLAVVAVAGAYSLNSSLYFGEYRDRYQIAAQPYTITGRILRGFAESNGSYGNAFMVAYPYWFDHRAIGIEGGRIDWPNGLLALDDLAAQIRANAGTEYAFDPNRAVLFFYSASDTETPAQLGEWFPEGTSILQPTDLQTKDFYTFTAPPPGEEWLAGFLAANTLE